MDEDRLERKDSENVDIKHLTVENIRVALTIKSQNVKILLNVIKNLLFTNNAEVQFTKNGMKYIAEESQFYQAQAFFHPDFFSKFNYFTHETIESFGVDLKQFAEFFSAILDNTLALLKIIYYGSARPMAFVFSQYDKLYDTDSDSEFSDEEIAEGKKRLSLISSEYIINIKHPINPIDFSILKPKLLSMVKVKGSEFYDILRDLYPTTVNLRIQIDKQAVTIKCLGIEQCSTEMKLSTAHRIFKAFEFHENSNFQYKYSCFKSIQKCVGISSEGTLETFENGLLKIQMLGKDPGKESLFFDFNIMPNSEDEDYVPSDSFEEIF